MSEKPYITIKVWPSVKSRKGRRIVRWVVDVYVAGERKQRFGYIRIYEAVSKPLLYIQSLIGKWVFTEEKKYKKPGVSPQPVFIIHFMGGVERVAELYTYYLLAITETRSRRKAGLLAKCLFRIDSISPYIDLFREIVEKLRTDRARRMIQAYCGAR